LNDDLWVEPARRTQSLSAASPSLFCSAKANPEIENAVNRPDAAQLGDLPPARVRVKCNGLS